MRVGLLATAILFVSLSPMAMAQQPEWQGHITWCHHDTDNPSGACIAAWGTGSAICIAPGAGGKRCVIEVAMQMARAGQCQAAWGVAVSCQCDPSNSGRGPILAAGPDAVCDFLRAGVP